MDTSRSAGILLHPTSLPGPHGIGELGPEALRFVEFLKEAGQSLWQVLPLGPTGPEGSPYSAYSAFAGNPLLISTDRLLDDGLLEPGQVPKSAPEGSVDYGAVDASKGEMLRRAYRNARAGRGFGEGFERFREGEKGWLGDYALYAALKEKFGGEPWVRWDAEIARREPAALKEARRELSDEISRHEFVQFLFYEHYGSVKKAANEAGVEIVGDLPIFVSHDSSDVWANQHLFYLDDGGSPTVVAGVPPDYFSETGQLWGNPLYRWDVMQEEGYAWWVSRLSQALTLYDATRIDHFRGFESYWEVSATAKTAKEGRWVEGPGMKLFRALRDALGDEDGLPLIAEDLGIITPAVEELRDAAGLPGMKVLQFGFSGPDNPYLPHNYRDANLVAYTGTHDNDTTAGWWASASDEEKRFARRYLGKEDVSVWDFMRLAHASVAARSIVPMQDALSLGSESRMNTPGEASGNWSWRMKGKDTAGPLARKLREVAELYNR